MINDGDMPRELSALVVPLRGLVETTGDLFQPYRLVDGDGVAVGPVSAFFAEVAACGRPATQRSYGMDLLRWFRFLWTAGVAWDQATRVEARDFCCWLQAAVKPARPHWRDPAGVPGSGVAPVAERVNAVTGKPSRGDRYQAATVAHCESVLRCFYDFHLEAGTGPMLNPFPLSRHRRPGRAQAHHNPVEPFAGQRSGRYRPEVVTRAPRCIPDERFDALFAQLGSHRDRALVAFWVGPDQHRQRVWAPDRRRRSHGPGTGGLVHRAGGAAMTSPVPVTSADPDAGSVRARGRARPGAEDAAWDREYGRDVWRLRELGITDRGITRISFTGISQPWLKNLAKRWARWRLSTGQVAETAALSVLAVRRFAAFLASPAVNVDRLAQVDRPLLESYLAYLHAKFGGRMVHRNMIRQLNLFSPRSASMAGTARCRRTRCSSRRTSPSNQSGCPAR